MGRRIVILQGHPDPAGGHLLHAMADAYAEAAISSGHEVRRIDTATLDFHLLRTQEEFEKGTVPPALVQPQADLRWAEHWVFLFPLWHGTCFPFPIAAECIARMEVTGIWAVYEMLRHAIPKSMTSRSCTVPLGNGTSTRAPHSSGM